MRGRRSWLIDQAFPAADTFDFAGSVRCDAVGKGLFSAVALEMDPGNPPAAKHSLLFVAFERRCYLLLSPWRARGVNS